MVAAAKVLLVGGGGTYTMRYNVVDNVYNARQLAGGVAKPEAAGGGELEYRSERRKLLNYCYKAALTLPLRRAVARADGPGRRRRRFIGALLCGGGRAWALRLRRAPGVAGEVWWLKGVAWRTGVTH